VSPVVATPGAAVGGAPHWAPPSPDGERAGELAVTVVDAVKTFGSGRDATMALDRIGLRVAPGELVCLVGASGCGKSTLLNLIAGLDRPTCGRVEAGGRVALMFQDAALFPWLTAAENVELPMRLAGMGRSARRTRARELLDLVHLNGVADRRPHQLSGGMRQRVALARALAQEADVLLMDEPFGALDAMTRDLLHDELEQLWLQRRPAIVFVTHNVGEAVRLGDRVLLLTSRPGRVAAEYSVAIPRPRRMDSPGVALIAAAITDRLREEVLRHVR
jgi:NitT/TauT family transport system ATP-binding protein